MNRHNDARTADTFQKEFQMFNISSLLDCQKKVIQINPVSEGQSELRPLKHVEGAASQTRNLLRRRPHRQLFTARGHLQGVTRIESRCNIKHTVADSLGAVT